MNTAVVKYRLWNLALRMNPQTAIYNVRTAATTPNGSDTFTSYNLLRVTYGEMTQDQFFSSGVGLPDQYRPWTIYQVDLDLAIAPTPQLTYQLVINGQTWIIEGVKSVALNQAFECRCRLQLSPVPT